jgi:hypothetical protein
MLNKTAPVLAEGTAGVEPAGEAEKAAAATLEALVPFTKDKAVCGLERPPSEGKCMHRPPPEALPPEGRCRPEAPSDRESEREADALPQEKPTEGKLRPGSMHEASPLVVNCMPETPPLRAKNILEVPLQMGERPEALQPGRERELDAPPQGNPNESKDRSGREVLRQGEHMHKVWPQGGLDEGEREPDWPP